jgi:glycosyltransferase involved in cell wall biosynthesis
LPEIAGESAVFCDPKNLESIAKAAHGLISNLELKNDIIIKGYENIKRFSWGDCSFRISQILTDRYE